MTYGSVRFGMVFDLVIKTKSKAIKGSLIWLLDFVLKYRLVAFR